MNKEQFSKQYLTELSLHAIKLNYTTTDLIVCLTNMILNLTLSHTQDRLKSIDGLEEMFNDFIKQMREMPNENN